MLVDFGLFSPVQVFQYFRRGVLKIMQITKTQVLDCVNWMKRRGFEATYCETREDARKAIVGMIEENWIVGCGDSTTIRSLGVIQDIADRGNRVLNSFIKPKIMREKPAPLPMSVMKQTCQGCDVFLCSANAVTLDGKIVSTDGGGMRVAGMFFGPPLSIIVIGRNKIVKDLDSALYRIRNVIAPSHAKTVGANWGFPCVAAGKCVEPETLCEGSKLRACNITVILEGKPALPGTRTAVILVNDDMGLGWDPAWPQERKDKIYAEYKEFTPPHRPIKE
jgi:hypothetical protein